MGRKKHSNFFRLEDLIFIILLRGFLCYKEQTSPLEREKIHSPYLWTQSKEGGFSSAAGKKFILNLKR